MDDLEKGKQHSRFCPTCGQPNPINHNPEWLLTRFGGIKGSALALLIKNRIDMKPTQARELVQFAYADRDRIPANADTTVKVSLYKIRPKLRELGWDVVGPNVTKNGYFLVPLERS